jgi:hypothetical protein
MVPNWQAEVPLDKIADPSEATARIKSHIVTESHQSSYIDPRSLPAAGSPEEAAYQSGAGQMRDFARQMLADIAPQQPPQMVPARQEQEQGQDQEQMPPAQRSAPIPEQPPVRDMRSGDTYSSESLDSVLSDVFDPKPEQSEAPLEISQELSPSLSTRTPQSGPIPLNRTLLEIPRMKPPEQNAPKPVLSTPVQPSFELPEPQPAPARPSGQMEMPSEIPDRIQSRIQQIQQKIQESNQHVIPPQIAEHLPVVPPAVLTPPTPPPLPAPPPVASPVDSSERYKFIEAGFNAAQNLNHDFSQRHFDQQEAHSVDDGFVQPHPDNVGPLPTVSGAYNATQNVPFNQPFDSGRSGTYSMNDLDSLRTGRLQAMDGALDDGDVLKQDLRGARPARIGQAESKRIMMYKLAKNYAVPAIVMLSTITLTLFVLFGKPAADNNQDRGAAASTQSGVPTTATTAAASSNASQGARFGLWRSADDSREVRLTSSTNALLVTGNSAVSIPYAAITNNWGDLLTAMFNSVFEKQLWTEKRDSGLKTQDDIVYYDPQGAEFKVIEKMRRVAAAAQAYFMKNGEYPKTVQPAMVTDFSFINPVNGKGSAVEIEPLLAHSIDGADAKATLESGLLVSDEVANLPLTVRCYAAVYSDSEDRMQGVRSTFFFVRGTDRNGVWLASGQAGRCYVVSAADTVVSLPAGSSPAARAARAKGKGRSPIGKTNKVEGIAPAPTVVAPQIDATSRSALRAVQIVAPEKNTKLWLITDPAWPMLLTHHALPLLLLLFAALALAKGKMVSNEHERLPAADRGLNIPMIVAALIFGLAILVIMAQFVLFA